MKTVNTVPKRRGRPRKVVTQETEVKKYFGKDLTIKDAFDAIAALEQRIAKIEKRKN